jgi:hypothetical protein
MHDDWVRWPFRSQAAGIRGFGVGWFGWVVGIFSSSSVLAACVAAYFSESNLATGYNSSSSVYIYQFVLTGHLSWDGVGKLNSSAVLEQSVCVCL